MCPENWDSRGYARRCTVGGHRIQYADRTGVPLAADKNPCAGAYGGLYRRNDLYGGPATDPQDRWPVSDDHRMLCCCQYGDGVLHFLPHGSRFCDLPFLRYAGRYYRCSAHCHGYGGGCRLGHGDAACPAIVWHGLSADDYYVDRPKAA